MAEVEKALGASGPVAMTGYVFTEAFAREHGDALRRFLAAAAKARAALASEPSLWAPIKARMHLTDDAALATYRERYAEGVPKRSVAEEAEDAKALYRAIVAVGGARPGRRRYGARSLPASSIRARRGEAWPCGSSRSAR